MRRVGLTLLRCGSCRHPAFTTRVGAGFAKADFPSIVGLVRHPSEGLVLFDTGYDAAFMEATRPFPERLYRWATPISFAEADGVAAWLARLGHVPADVSHVVLSHFHGDHVSGLHRFPHAKLHCSEAGLARLGEGSRLARTRRGLLPALVPADAASRASFFERGRRVPLPPEYAPFAEGVDVLGDGSLLALPLPGHCPGHWGLALRLDDDRRVLMAADAAWSVGAVEDDAPPPALTTSLLGETGPYRDTLSRLHALHASGTGVTIVPSHCDVALARFVAEAVDA